jgi:hypothetical protein
VCRILATGSLSNVQLRRNRFRGSGDFSAGFLHAPAASFVDPLAVAVAGTVQTRAQSKPPRSGAKTARAHSAAAARAAAPAAARAATPAAARAAAPAAARAATPAAARTAAPARGIRAAASVQGASSGAAAWSATRPTVSPQPAFSRWETAFGIDVQSITLASNGGTAIPSLLQAAVIENNSFEGLSTPILILAATEGLELKGNQSAACRAGFWILTPSEPFLLLNEIQQIGVFGLSLAIGYPLPAGDSSTAVAVSASPAPVRIYTGSAPYTDSAGYAWVPDILAPTVSVSSGSLNQPIPPPQISNALPAAADQALYQNERWGADFTYTFSNLSAGFYLVTLKLAEIVFTNPGQRVFNVFINGVQVLNQLDLVQQYGALFAADLTFDGIPSVDAQITVEFSGIAGLGDGNAKCSAISILPEWSQDFITYIGQNLAGAPLDDVQNFFLQAVQLAQQGFAGSSPLALQLRIENNEMQALSTVGLMVLASDSVQNGAQSSLIVAGNRMAGAVGAFGEAGVFRRAVQNRDLKATFRQASGAFNRLTYYGYYFDSIAFIFYVARCIVANNMIMNNTPAQERVALVVVDGTLTSPDIIVPAPEVSVTGNVIKGVIAVAPGRDEYFAGVPYPMDTWEFFNTVVY